MMKIIKDLLIKIINDIDTGNSNLSADECNKVIEYLTEITNKNEKLSKYQACKYTLKVSLSYVLIIMLEQVRFLKVVNK